MEKKLGRWSYAGRALVCAMIIGPLVLGAVSWESPFDLIALLAILPACLFCSAVCKAG